MCRSVSQVGVAGYTRAESDQVIILFMVFAVPTEQGKPCLTGYSRLKKEGRKERGCMGEHVWVHCAESWERGNLYLFGSISHKTSSPPSRAH
jgi:hypothetical protein